MKVRETALADPANVAVKDALTLVSSKEAALSSALTISQVDSAAVARRSVQKTIRTFNNSTRLKGLRRTKRHRNKRAWARFASSIRDTAKTHTLSQQNEPERSSVDPATGWCNICRKHELCKSATGGFQHPTACVKTKPQVVHVGFIGDAGTCVGSRIGGHARRGGKHLRAEHRQHAVVAVTDEYLSSQRCPFCLERTRPARSRRKKRDGGIKTVSVKGSMECTNKDCPSFLCGYTMKPRDSQGAVNIGTNGEVRISVTDLMETNAPLAMLVGVQAEAHPLEEKLSMD
ncbi:hypothetical protein DFQ26_002207 [Actinomortierella ambigua]|nr:hypothetical protein DFQ26_002207 [Actinomortierella ambigua]